MLKIFETIEIIRLKNIQSKIVDKKKFYKYRSGNPTLIFFHGLCGNRNHFDESFKYLKKKGILTLDLLGFGRNKEIIKLKSSIVKQQVELITKIISKLNLEKLTLVFHSLSTVFLPFILRKKN